VSNRVVEKTNKIIDKIIEKITILINGINIIIEIKKNNNIEIYYKKYIRTTKK
jgi:hypothetical protein